MLPQPPSLDNINSLNDDFHVHTNRDVKLRRLALREAFTLFQTEWTRDHVLGVAPTSDAAILSSPLQQLHSLAFENDLSFGSVNEGDLQMNGVLSGESIVVPAYNKGNLSAGYIVEECYGLYPKEVMLCHNGLSALRFITREETGTFIGFQQLPHVDVIIHYQSKNRRNLFHGFGFEAGTIQKLVTSNSNFSTFEAHLKVSVSSEAWQACSNCGVAGKIPCVCPSGMIRPKSPLDLGPISYNVRMACIGLELGNGKYERFENGVLKEVLALSSQHRIVNVPRHGSAKKLVNWAISDALKAVPISISRVIRSPLASQSSSSYDDNYLPNMFNSFNDSVQSEPLLLNDFNQNTNSSDVSPDTTSVESCLHITSVSNSAALPPSSIPIANNVNVSNANSFWPASNSTTMVDSSMITMSQQNTPPTTSHYMPQQYQQLVPSPPTVTLPPTMRIVPEHNLTATQPVVAGGGQRVAFSGVIPIAPHTVQNIASQQPQQQQQQAAPTPPADATAAQSMEEKMKKSAEELRAWKAYQRKLRNRESAARSNLARKQRRLEQARLKKNQKSASTKVKG